MDGEGIAVAGINTQPFICEKGEVGHNGVNYYTIGSGHVLCVELFKEIIRLRSELAKPYAIVEPIRGPG